MSVLDMIDNMTEEQMKARMREIYKIRNKLREEIKEYEDYFYNKKIQDENFNRIVHLHANIVEFDSKCMIFKPLSYFKYCRWIKKQCKNKNRVKGLWDN